MPKQKKKKERYVQVCPRCKSPDIRMDKSTLQQIGALPTMYICNKCGHSSYAFPQVEILRLKKFEDEVDKKKLRDTKKDKSELVDTAYGKFEIRFIWKFAGPFLVLIGILILFKIAFDMEERIVGTIVLFLGIIMTYITYFKKRRLKPN